MKIARFFSCLLGIFGAALMVLSIGVILLSLNRAPMLVKEPAGAVACAEEMMEAFAQGDYASAAQKIYGQPELGASGKPEDIAGIMVWDAFLASISYEFKSECYITDSGLALDATITALDIPSVTVSLSRRAHDLLSARVENAQDMAELYDENNEFRADVVEDVLAEALVRALAEDAKTISRDVTLRLILRDGQWWVVPDQALLTVLSGMVA